MEFKKRNKTLREGFKKKIVEFSIVRTPLNLQNGKAMKNVFHAMPPILYDMGHLTDARGLIHPESSKLEAYHLTMSFLTMIFAMGAPHPPKKYCKNRDHFKAISSVLSS